MRVSDEFLRRRNSIIVFVAMDPFVKLHSATHELTYELALANGRPTSVGSNVMHVKIPNRARQEREVESEGTSEARPLEAHHRSGCGRRNGIYTVRLGRE